MKELRILVEDHLLTTALDAVLPHVHRVVIDTVPGTTYVQVPSAPAPAPTPKSVPPAQPRRFPPDPIVSAEPSPPASTPLGFTRVQAHYNHNRYVPEHVRPNPQAHKRRPPLAKTDPPLRKAQILDLLRRHHPATVTRRAIDSLARLHHDHPSHWRGTLRGLVRYKHIVRDGSTYALPPLAKTVPLGDVLPDFNSRDEP